MSALRPPAVRLKVEAVELFERDVRLRLPFRFGVVTLTAAPQAFVRVRVRLADGREGWGAAAEMLVPKWFDKDPALSNEANFDQLRAALRITAEAYTRESVARTPFDLYASHLPAQYEAGATQGLNPLVASYGPALIDRAVLDALLRLENLSVFAGLRANVAGIGPTPLAPDLADFDFAAFLDRIRPRTTIAARHTVGLVDPIVAADVTTRLDDGLPETLEEVVVTYGHRHFKLKVGGDVAADLDRLQRIASVIDVMPAPYVVTLDGNEQYRDVDGIAELWSRVEATRSLARLADSTIFIEQPIHRGNALGASVERLAGRKPLLVDESDATLDAFVQAKALGYTGVSSKACKGFYKSILNAARCARWNADTPGRFFLSGEDLTCQAGLAVQQDLALVALLGVDHVERNGHHYVDGFGPGHAHEAAAFAAAHPDLYTRAGDGARLRIERGNLAIASLDTPGFGSRALPDWAALRQTATFERT